MAAEGIAVVIGATGGIGRAIWERLEGNGAFARVIGLSRRSDPALDLAREDSIEDAAHYCADLGEIRLVVDATGFLHDEDAMPEKSLRDLDAEKLARSFALNAIGPALLMKHFLPRLPRKERAVFATLSAKVGSIGDNRLGGWYGYRAAKAALNQLVRTAAVELRRTHPHALCVAVHPGTVDTELSKPFAKAGLDLQTPDEAAAAILSTLERLTHESSGFFFDRTGERLPW